MNITKKYRNKLFIGWIQGNVILEKYHIASFYKMNKQSNYIYEKYPLVISYIESKWYNEDYVGRCNECLEYCIQNSYYGITYFEEGGCSNLMICNKCSDNIINFYILKYG